MSCFPFVPCASTFPVCPSVSVIPAKTAPFGRTVVGFGSFKVDSQSSKTPMCFVAWRSTSNFHSHFAGVPFTGHKPSNHRSLFLMLPRRATGSLNDRPVSLLLFLLLLLLLLVVVVVLPPKRAFYFWNENLTVDRTEGDALRGSNWCMVGIKPIPPARRFLCRRFCIVLFSLPFY